MAEKRYDFDFRWKDASGELVPNGTKVETAESAYWAHVPEAARPHVLDGSISASVDSVTASAKIVDAGKKVERTAITSYIRLEANTPQAALFLMDGRMKATEEGAGVLTRFNYGFDLDRRGTVRNPLLQKLEGPEKAIERAIKGLLGIPGMTEDEARKMVAARFAAIQAAEAPAEA